MFKVGDEVKCIETGYQFGVIDTIIRLSGHCIYLHSNPNIARHYSYFELVKVPVFKVGDKVRCVDVTSDQEGLRLGDVYTITYISPSGRVQVSEIGNDALWFPTHFALVPNEMEVKHYEIEINVDVSSNLDNSKWVTLESKGVVMRCETILQARNNSQYYGRLNPRIVEVSETRKIVE